MNTTREATLTASSVTEADIYQEITTAGVYILTMDLSALAAGDTIYVCARERVLTAGTSNIVYEAYFADPQAYPVVKSPPINSAHSINFRYMKVSGTTRNIPYRIDTL